MEIRGQNIMLTPSEAAWLQAAFIFTSHFNGDLAQRILDARVAFVSPHVPAGELPTRRAHDFTNGSSYENIMNGTELLAESSALSVHETRLAGNPDGSERHVISVTMSREDIAETYRTAKARHTFASTRAGNPDAYGKLGDALQEDALEALELGEPISDDSLNSVVHGMSEPDEAAWQAQCRDYAAEDTHDLAITTGILNAIEAAGLAPGQSSQ